MSRPRSSATVLAERCKTAGRSEITPPQLAAGRVLHQRGGHRSWFVLSRERRGEAPFIPRGASPTRMTIVCSGTPVSVLETPNVGECSSQTTPTARGRALRLCRAAAGTSALTYFPSRAFSTNGAMTWRRVMWQANIEKVEPRPTRLANCWGTPNVKGTAVTVRQGHPSMS